MLHKDEEVSPYLLLPLRSLAEVESERRARSISESLVPHGLVTAPGSRKPENDDNSSTELHMQSWWRIIVRRSKSMFDA